MAYKVLGQVAPAAATDTTLYTVPTDKSAVASTLTVCNRSASASAKIRVAVRPGGAALANQHYIFYELPVGAEDTAAFTIGMTLAVGDVVTVRSSTADVSFSMFGQEV